MGRLKRKTRWMILWGAISISACNSDMPTSSLGVKPAADSATPSGFDPAKHVGLQLSRANFNRCAERTIVRDANGGIARSSYQVHSVNPKYVQHSDRIKLFSGIAFDRATGRQITQVDCVLKDDSVSLPFMKSLPNKALTTIASGGLVTPIPGLSITWCTYFESENAMICNGRSCPKGYQRPGVVSQMATALRAMLSVGTPSGYYECDNGCTITITELGEDQWEYSVGPEDCDLDEPPTGGGGSSPDPYAQVRCNSATAFNGNINCQITTFNGTSSSVEWRFDGETQGVFATKSGGLVWEGPGVIGGTVRAIVDFGSSAPDTVFDNFTVPRRSGWQWDASSISLLPDGTGELNSCFRGSLIYTALGITTSTNCGSHSAAKIFQDWSGYLSDGNGFTVDSVSGGPNVGIYYVASADVMVTMRYALNPNYRAGSPATFNITSTTQPLYSACGFSAPQTLNLSQIHTTWCVPDPGAYWAYKIDQVVLPHENEHLRLVGEAATDASGLNDLRKIWEPMTATSKYGLIDDLKQQAAAVENRIIVHSKEIDGADCQTEGNGTQFSTPVKFWYYLPFAPYNGWVSCTSRFVLHR